MEILLRAAVASLLNASFHEVMDTPDGVYPYTVQEVITLVNEAICSRDRTIMLLLYDRLDAINNGIHYIDWSWSPGQTIPIPESVFPTGVGMNRRKVYRRGHA